MDMYEKLAENIIRDYFTPNIKAEVILDMILTPVIGDILTIAGKKNKGLGISGKMTLIAKEFPMLKSRFGGQTSGEKSKNNYRSCNVDYLMCDAESVYFVELKTTQGSLDRDQMINYRKYIADCEDEKFSDVSGTDFIKLLNHVSWTGHLSNHANKTWKETEPRKDDLKRVFEAVIQYPEHGRSGENEEIPFSRNWAEEEAHHVDDAIAYLKKNEAVSSKKYLLTAGQMLDNMKAGEWWDCKHIKLLYLMPEMPSDDKREILEYYQKGIVIIVTFREIMEHAYLIGREVEKRGLKNYWNWIMEILIQCGLN